MTRTALTLVKLQTEPEADLRRLFRREAAIEAELAAIRADQHRARQLYAAKHNLLMLPGFTKLRDLFG